MSARYLLAAVFLVAALGCGIRTGGDNPEQPGGGAPVNEQSEGGAIGSPIKMPEINRRGDDVAGVKAELEDDIRDACGDNELCVRVEVKPGSNTNFTRCQFDKTEPAKGTEVPRGSTVYVVTGSRSCTTTRTTEPPRTEPPQTEPPQTEPPETDQPEPTNTR
jgi:hypothetical protein